MCMILLIPLLINRLPNLLQAFFCCSPCNVKIVDVQQTGCNECGLFAFVNAITITFGRSPVKAKYDQWHMRNHLVATEDATEDGSLS